MLGDDLNRINPEVPEQLFQYGLTTHEFADKRWEQEKARSSSIISDLFQWQLRSRSKCGCGALTFQFDAAFILSLAFPPAKKKTATNLHDMLQHYTSKEEVEDFYCERCNKNTTGRRKLDLWRLPSNLVVHLKRFSIDFDVTTKIMDAVDFPIDGLDLTPFTSSKQTDPPIYDLYAVTNHGGSTGGGHYWAYVKNFVDNKWYELNDPTASPLDVNKLTDNATRKTAYLLFYRRRKNLDRLA
jgi:ubiquitin C-terminal hydrolase